MTGDMADLWRAAIADVRLRHPNGRSTPILRISSGTPPEMYVGLDATTCTLTGKLMVDFSISTIVLTYWPGVRVAQMWMAAAWVGYLQHEALELATVGGRAIIDPHAEPYASNPANRGLRYGMPPVLTPITLAQTLALVLPHDMAAVVAYGSLKETQ
jgi:hypothetical protein